MKKEPLKMDFDPVGEYRQWYTRVSDESGHHKITAAPMRIIEKSPAVRIGIFKEFDNSYSEDGSFKAIDIPVEDALELARNLAAYVYDIKPELLEQDEPVPMEVPEVKAKLKRKKVNIGMNQ